MEKLIENPWKDIKEVPFYFEEDKKIIDEFNLKLENNPHFIHSDLMPEPYMGNPKANVILLFANPGYGANERIDYTIPKFKKAIENNLTHSNTEYPYYYLNPEFKHQPSNGKSKYTDGGKWIRDRTKVLSAELKIEDKELAKKIFTLQLHPYHSARFKNVKKPFKGYEYSMSLFSNAIERAKKGEALIICARSYKHWNAEYQKLNKKNEGKDLKKDLENNFIEMLHPRSVYFTTKNLGKDEEGNENFQKLVAKLKQPL